MRKNPIFIGGTGTGKTHLCIGVASAVIRSRARGRFFNLVDLVNQLEQEKAAGRSGRLAETLLRDDVIVIDELGYTRAYRQAFDWLFDPTHKGAAVGILRERIPAMSASLAETSYEILLNPTHGFARDAAIDLEGITTVLRLRSEYGRPRKTLDDPGKYLDLSSYNAASTRKN